MPKTRCRHDAAYKNLFTDPEMVASLLRRFAPADVVADMDFSSLEPFPTEHVAEDRRARRERAHRPLAPYQPQQEYCLLDAGRVPEAALAGNHDLATLLIRLERAHDMKDIIRILAELCTLLPPSERLYLHRAFISWLGSSVFRRTQLSENILHCTTIQEARSMLADIAPHWEQRFMEKGFSMGKQEGISIGRSEGISIGIKKILREILTHRFGALPHDVTASIEGIANTNDLQKLTHEAYQVSSFQAFRALLDRIGK